MRIGGAMHRGKQPAPVIWCCHSVPALTVYGVCWGGGLGVLVSLICQLFCWLVGVIQQPSWHDFLMCLVK